MALWCGAGLYLVTGLIESFDPVSNERVFVLVDKSPKLADAGELSWDSINKTLEYYAERFKVRMQPAK